MFTWHDFKQFDVAPETLANYCNQIFKERTTPVSLDKHGHDVVRDDANFTKEYLAGYPRKARMTYSEKK